jgi:uncharacterized membrane protein
MPSYETSVEVAAPPARVYAVTADVESWPGWSPTMDAVTREDDGPIRPGSTARVRQPKLRPATWVVDEATPDSAFVWHTAGPGYRVTGTHVLEPHQGDDDRTTVRLGVAMTGPLAPVLWALTGRTARRYVDEEAAALKRRCESA